MTAPEQNEGRFRRASVAAFTLLEIVMVLSIMGIVAGIAVPNVDQAMKTYRADLAARQVLTDLQATRMRALSQNVRYRMVFTANGTTYVQQMRDPTTLVYATVANYTLPAQATFTATVADPVFAPGGVITIPPPASVVIQGAGGAVALTRTITFTAGGSMRLAP